MYLKDASWFDRLATEQEILTFIDILVLIESKYIVYRTKGLRLKIYKGNMLFVMFGKEKIK